MVEKLDVVELAALGTIRPLQGKHIVHKLALPTNSTTIKQITSCTLKDRRSSITFLIDTGAQVSATPENVNKHSKPTYNLRSANGAPTASYGQNIMTLDLNLLRDFQWDFMVATVPFASIGIDFSWSPQTFRLTY